jgi:RNA polymerase sigma-70 factor (ECF subfamily)
MDQRPETVRELFDAEYGPLVRLATLITGDVASAEDVVQEAFARTIARWRRIRSYDRPGAWVRRVTIRLAVRDRTRRLRELSSLLDAEPAVVDPEPPDPELLGALQALPRNQRAALVLFYFEGLPTEAIATELGVAPSTARSLLHRGRAAVARRLELPEKITDGH